MSDGVLEEEFVKKLETSDFHELFAKLRLSKDFRRETQSVLEFQKAGHSCFGKENDFSFLAKSSEKIKRKDSSNFLYNLLQLWRISEWFDQSR